MKQYFFSRRSRILNLSGVLAAVVLGVAASPALAAGPPPPAPPAPPAPAASGVTSVDTSACTSPVLSQSFLSARDNNWYTLVPGESPDSFDGSGWTLSGGASVVTTSLQDGSQGSVLDLPSGASALSPAICVTSDYPVARTIVRNVVGAEGVQFYVSYEGTNTWLNPRNTGQVHGQQSNWTLSDPVNLQPTVAAGWQIVRFKFVAGGQHSDFQIYDFYVDPRMKL
jgi:hypothetical protein